MNEHQQDAEGGGGGRGAVVEYVSPIFDVRGQTLPTQGITIDVEGVARGWLLVSASVVDDLASSGAHAQLYIDVLLVGHIGSSSFLLERFGLSGDQPLALYQFAEDQSLNAISVWARQMVDGVPNADVVPLVLQLQATGTFTRGGRS